MKVVGPDHLHSTLVRHPSPRTRVVYSTHRGRLRSSLGPAVSSLQKPSSGGLTATPTAALPTPLAIYEGVGRARQRPMVMMLGSYGLPQGRCVRWWVSMRMLLPRTAPMSRPRKDISFQRRSFSLPCGTCARSNWLRGLHPPWDVMPILVRET